MTTTNNIDKAIADINSCEDKLSSSIAILQLLKHHYSERGMDSNNEHSLGKSICITLDFINEALSHAANVGDYIGR